VRLHEIYPPKLPDLLHGQQLVVIGRYEGQGPAAIKLAGHVGGEMQSFVYETTFPRRTDDDKVFVEHLWARRKVGYLLDQIRSNGQSRELVEEVTKLAKRYGIATPYTSYLVVPDGPMPVAQPGRFRSFEVEGAPRGGGGGLGIGGGFGGAMLPGGPPASAAGQAQKIAGAGLGGGAGAGGRGGFGGAGSPDTGIAGARGEAEKKQIDEALKSLPADKRADALRENLARAKEQNEQLAKGADNYEHRRLEANQTGKLGVDLAEAGKDLKEQKKLSLTAMRAVNGRNCVEIGGLWIDDKFEAKQQMVIVKAQSDAYFRILEKQPDMKEVFRLGNYVVWTAPSGRALVIDANEGKEKLDDQEIDALFTKR